MEDKLSPTASSLDQKNELLKIDEQTVDNIEIKDRARGNLFQAAKELKKLLPGHSHTGSIAIHYYFSELSGPTYVTQLNHGNTREYMVATSYNRLFHALTKTFGKEMEKKK